MTHTQRSLNLGSILLPWSMTGSGPAPTCMEINENVLPPHYTFPLILNVNCVVLSIMDFTDTQQHPLSHSSGFSDTVHQIKKKNWDEGTIKSDISTLVNVMESNFYQAVNGMLKSMLSRWGGEPFARRNNVRLFCVQSFVISAWCVLNSVQWGEATALPVLEKKISCNS